MSEFDVLDVAGTWSFWDRPVPASVPRDIDLPSTLRDSLCLAIQGVRRCGKSTLLQQLIGRYELEPERCALLNFEDPRLARAQSFAILDLLVTRFRERHGNDGLLYFFLDEIQGSRGLGALAAGSARSPSRQCLRDHGLERETALGRAVLGAHGSSSHRGALSLRPRRAAAEAIRRSPWSSS